MEFDLQRLQEAREMLQEAKRAEAEALPFEKTETDERIIQAVNDPEDKPKHT